jgi:hypothetical protein
MPFKSKGTSHPFQRVLTNSPDNAGTGPGIAA